MADPAKDGFAELLARLSGGRTNVEATAALREVAKAVIDETGKGAVVITMAIEPVGKTGYQVQIATTVTKKMPKSGPEVTVHFVDEIGDLKRDDPFQGRLAESTEGAEA